jgi:serine/threonine protein kinase
MLKGVKEKVFYKVGTPIYMSPESYLENKYSEKSDIWSIGVVYYQMLYG